MATGKTIVGPVGAHTNKVPSVLFTSDGKQFITASLDKSIRVWDSTTGKEVGDPMLGHEEGIHQIALSHDGHRLASVDGVTVRVWDLTTRRQVGDRLQAPDEFSFYSIAWSLNGRSIVAGTREGEIDLWDVPSLEVEDSAMTPVVVAGHPPQPSSPRPRTDSLSPSILDLPAAGPSNQSKSSQPPRRDDFWDTSDIDLPARACPQISTISIAEAHTLETVYPEDLKS
ncbi:WD40-repeat-containing domain protein [Hygrophoropsis aurantiaca]|uniref:WD40-repeat-containing domain protein n=1 Tax=Hygrophoropsis aurantiaca TaxID=72124 RepID=A0ACB8A2E1_9AGAM|nr:WD40-repeat-containing domain protein [Hygrophoropsis aurantiaca]